MVCRVERPPERGDVVTGRRRRVDVRGEHGLDLAFGVGTQPPLEIVGVVREPRFGLDQLDVESEEAGHLAPDRGESSAVEHQDPITLRQCVGQGHLPGTVTVADRHDRTLGRAGERGQRIEHLVGDGEQFTVVDVEHRAVHGGEHTVRYHRGARNRHDLLAGCERSHACESDSRTRARSKRHTMLISTAPTPSKTAST